MLVLVLSICNRESIGEFVFVIKWNIVLFCFRYCFKDDVSVTMLVRIYVLIMGSEGREGLFFSLF